MYKDIHYQQEWITDRMKKIKPKKKKPVNKDQIKKLYLKKTLCLCEIDFFFFN